MALGMEVGLSPGDFCLMGTSFPFPKNGAEPPPQFMVHFWATVCKAVRPMLSVRCPVCLSVLSVTLVYCGQTAGWINMALGMEVGLSPGDFVLMGTQPNSPKGAEPPPQFMVHFWATVCKAVRPMLSVRCPVCLS